MVVFSGFGGFSTLISCVVIVLFSSYFSIPGEGRYFSQQLVSELRFDVKFSEWREV